MEELVFFPPSPSSQFFPIDHDVLEFESCEVPEQWLLGDVVMAKNQKAPEKWLLGDVVKVQEQWPTGDAIMPKNDVFMASKQSNSETSELPAASTQRPAKRRGRKPGPRPGAASSTVSHVEAERQRRDKLNRRFCDLRAAVPTVSRMDKASLLGDAAAYIAELRAQVARLEDEARRHAAATRRQQPSGESMEAEEAVEVRMMGRDAAAVRVTTAARHAAARLMGAMRALEVEVQHACVSRVQGVTVQDVVVVDVPAALQDHGSLRSALLQQMHDGA